MLGSQGEATSPFNQIISSSYYDGTTAGIAKCGVCFREYIYELLSWDSGQDLRIFGLWEVPKGSFSELVDFCSGFDRPRWPEWSPIFQGPERQRYLEAFRAKFERIRRLKSSLQIVVATEEISRLIVASKAADGMGTLKELHLAETFSAESFADWMTFLKRK
jgi:hypothetical protein